MSPLLERLISLERELNADVAPVKPREWLLERVDGRPRLDGFLREWLEPENFVAERTDIRDDGQRHVLSAHWLRTTDVSQVKMSNARRLKDEQVLVTCEIELTGEASYDDDVVCAEHGVLRELVGWSSWTQPHTVRIEMELLLDVEAKRIEASDVGDVQVGD